MVWAKIVAAVLVFVVLAFIIEELLKKRPQDHD